MKKAYFIGLSIIVVTACAVVRAQRKEESMAPKPVKVSFAGAAVSDDPIPPAQIIEGHPEAKTFVLHSDADGRYTSGIWQCTPGKFRWNYPIDEFVYFVEGEATIAWDNGDTITLRKGEAAQLPKGDCTWTIAKTVKKLFVVRQ